MRTKYNFSALDTETVNGYARILATEHRHWLAHSFDECVKPFLNDRSHNKISGRIFMFNMDYDIRAIIKYLPEENLHELIEDNQTTWNDYQLKYIAGKFARLKYKGYRTVSFYDLAQFYNFVSLDNSAKQWLNKSKDDSDTIDFFIHYEQTDDFIKHNYDELAHYCQQDALLTKLLAEHAAKEYEKLFGWAPKTWVSRAVIAETLTLKGGAFYPRYKPDHPAARYAHAAYKGGMFEVNMRGSFNEITQLDISSAYPSVMINLPHWGNGRFEFTNNEKDIAKHDYAWILCSFDCPHLPFKTNVLHSWDEMHKNYKITTTAQSFKIFYPTGYRIDVITKPEFEFMKKYGFPVTFINAWYWIKESNQYSNPFAWVQDIYDQKQAIKDAGDKKTYKYDLCKRAINGAYGKTAQKMGVGKMRNFFYASYITGKTRMKIENFVFKHKLQAYHIGTATDSIVLLDHHKFTPQQLGKGIGSWDLERFTNGLVLGNGIYEFTREDGRLKTAARGITNDPEFELRKLLERHPNKTEFIPSYKPKPVTLIMALTYKNIYTKEDMNVFINRGRKISINTDRNKKWYGINNFHDLLARYYIGERYSIEDVKPVIKHVIFEEDL